MIKKGGEKFKENIYQLLDRVLTTWPKAIAFSQGTTLST